MGCSPPKPTHAWLMGEARTLWRSSTSAKPGELENGSMGCYCPRRRARCAARRCRSSQIRCEHIDDVFHRSRRPRHGRSRRSLRLAAGGEQPQPSRGHHPLRGVPLRPRPRRRNNRWCHQAGGPAGAPGFEFPPGSARPTHRPKRSRPSTTSDHRCRQRYRNRPPTNR